MATPPTAAPRGRLVPRRLSAPIVLSALAAAGGIAAAVVVVVSATTGGSSKGPDALSQAVFEERTGVRVARLAVTGGGGLVDFRYQVIDPDKALGIHRGSALVDEDSGAVLTDLYGHQNPQGKPAAGRTYFLLFVNRKGSIQPNGRVSVRIGGSLLEHVHVR